MNAPGRIEFLRPRLDGIGGSDIGAILGVSPFKSAVDVYLSKVDPEYKSEEKEIFYWGHVLENPIIDRFERDNEVEVQRSPVIERHREHKWMLANVDGIINTVKPGVLEVKTVSAFGGKDWGATDTDEVPLSYVAQVAWYMAVLDYDYAKIAALFGGNDYREFHIDRDPELEGILIDKGREFWFDNVKAETPPEASNSADLSKLYKHDDGSSISADHVQSQVVTELKLLKMEYSAQAEKIKQLERDVKSFIGESSALTYQDDVIATWKSQTAKRLDTKALKQAHPDLYEQFCKASETRVLRIK